MASAGPRLLTLALRIGIGLAILVVIAGIVLAVRSPAQSTPMRDRAVRRRYGIVVGLEFALLGAGRPCWRSAGSRSGYPCGYAPASASISSRYPGCLVSGLW